MIETHGSHATLDDVQQAELEHALTREIRRFVILAVPLFVCLWIGLVALAITIAGAGYTAPLAMAAGIGVLAGLVFGTWLAFVRFNQKLDELEHQTGNQQRWT